MIDQHWMYAPAAAIDNDAINAAWARQKQLTKPPGALGQLETLAVRLAGMQGRDDPRLERLWISVFAADHGIAADGVSAFPQDVTAQMVSNMAHGGAAISVLATALAAEWELIVLGTLAPVPAHPAVRHELIAPSTAHLALEPALTDTQLQQALASGRAAAERAKTAHTDLFIGGEMGIGNTTSAAALGCAYLEQPAETLVGFGTGIDLATHRRKCALVSQALQRHQAAFNDPLEVLRCLGGFEIAALAGAYIHCAQQGIPILLDGFISSAAALAAMRLCPGAESWMLLGHASVEQGHRAMAQALGLTPILDLQLRLGEGSGAAVAVPVLRLACALHQQMATFSEAGVSCGA